MGVSEQVLIVALGVGLGFVVTLYILRKRRALQVFIDNDILYAKDALTKLYDDIDQRVVNTISNNHLTELFESGDILIANHPQGVNENKENGKEGMEGMSFFNPVNTRYWPQYYYSFPYQYTEGGAWPPGMYSRLYNWQPGYDTAGWSYWMRPGMSYQRWPRNRWVHNNGSYYFINNGKDRSKDYM